MAPEAQYIRWLEELGSKDVGLVGGKNASLGEMLANLQQRGIRVPPGFATTADAYRRFLEEAGLVDTLRTRLDALRDGGATLQQTGEAIRTAIRGAPMPEALAAAICDAYRELGRRHESDAVDVAVRSSATAEDLPDASFAGQQETFLNIRGEEALLDACRNCFASLFTNRAISYREARGFDHMDVALSIGVQKMVRSDVGSAGVLFTIDTETGFPDAMVINAAWGLGESVVQGSVIPDEYRIYKPLLDAPEGYRPIIDQRLGRAEQKMVYGDGDDEPVRRIATTSRERSSFVLCEDDVLQLARWGVAIEQHYGRPMDVEWAKDGENGLLYIVQARPETVQSRPHAVRRYKLRERGEALVEGLAIGDAVASGKAFVLRDVDESDRFEDGGVLVTTSTDPDWVPLMRRAAAIVTDHGGRTSHAAIVSRELGVPAITGTGEATRAVADGTELTISCAEGETGYVYAGKLPYSVTEIGYDQLPDTNTKVMINLASPDAALRWWNLPCDGVGLARMEFVINNVIQVHPMALVRFASIEDARAREHIEVLTRGYESKAEYFVDHLARGIAKIAAARCPHRVVVRFSDFKTNEYADLVGGRAFEPHEENPMLGFRGASRYYSDRYREAFGLECEALRRARDVIGMQNVIAMVPFCRTPEEADRVLEVMAQHGLQRGRNGFQVYVMAEIPSNVLLAEQFAERFDGFSIGSNDLTQLVLGVDRDSELLAPLFSERNEAVQRAIRQLIQTAHRSGTPVGLCGQAPSDHPEFAAFLVDAGIDSISVDPSTLLEVRQVVARAESERG